MSDLEGIKEAVTKAWSQHWFGDPMAILCKKLKRVKVEIILVNKKNGNIHSNVGLARANLHDIEERLDDDTLNHGLNLEEQSSTKRLVEQLDIEEKLLIQKFRVKW